MFLDGLLERTRWFNGGSLFRTMPGVRIRPRLLPYGGQNSRWLKGNLRPYQYVRSDVLWLLGSSSMGFCYEVLEVASYCIYRFRSMC